jgi:hypothetical protein
MAITAVRCHVSGADVIRITDLEGAATRVICSDYQESTGGCRLLKNAHKGGPLARLLDRVAEGALADRTTQCYLRVPRHDLSAAR